MALQAAEPNLASLCLATTTAATAMDMAHTLQQLQQVCFAAFGENNSSQLLHFAHLPPCSAQRLASCARLLHAVFFLLTVLLSFLTVLLFLFMVLLLVFTVLFFLSRFDVWSSQKCDADISESPGLHRSSQLL